MTNALNDEIMRQKVELENKLLYGKPRETWQGRISQFAVDWAVNTITAYITDEFTLTDPEVEHARWIIEKVHDGTLVIGDSHE